MNAHELLALTTIDTDTFVGVGPKYPWGGLYGGQIVAQALRAAAATVESALNPHSLRAYFIRSGDHNEPVHYEVDRIRDGRTFCTRRVVARQAGGAILNLEASFQRDEASVEIEGITMPDDLPGPDELQSDSWSSIFERAIVPGAAMPAANGRGSGRGAMWARSVDPLGDDPLVHWCMLAYLSDDLPCDAVLAAHPMTHEVDHDRNDVFLASLDHTIWFHRPFRADEWHLYEMTCHSFVGGRGLAIGHVFGIDGVHVATVAQEALLRDRRTKP